MSSLTPWAPAVNRFAAFHGSVALCREARTVPRASRGVLLVWLLALICSAALPGCVRQSAAPAAPAAVTAPASPVGLAQSDLGASMLAAIENARAAIALHDAVAADIDVVQALGFADQAINRVSAILPPQDMSAAGRSTARADARSLTAVLGTFPVRVRLSSVQTLLTAGDLADADHLLGVLEREVPDGLIPQDLSLLQAGASLDRARQAASLGTTQLRTQLLCARAALLAYRGPEHVEDARALASTLDAVLADPTRLRTLLPYQVSPWLGVLAGWAGRDRW